MESPLTPGALKHTESSQVDDTTRKNDSTILSARTNVLFSYQASALTIGLQKSITPLGDGKIVTFQRMHLPQLQGSRPSRRMIS